MRRVQVAALPAVASSVLATAGLLVRGRLRCPATRVGQTLRFADGTTSRIYRETVLSGEPTREPALLVVGFRLRFVGHSRLMHALFRAESLANTPLFAGFPGFRSKLWITDALTGAYRGMYEWDGAGRAETYVTALTAVLRPFCVPESIRYHIEPGIRRDDFLRDPAVVGAAAGDGSESWWLLREPGG